MNPYVFMTDSDSDLPFRYVDELDMTMVYTVSYTHLTLPTIRLV